MLPAQDLEMEDLPREVKLYDYRVRFATDVTGKVKVTCRAFPQMMIREDDLNVAIANTRSRMRQLIAVRMATH